MYHAATKRSCGDGEEGGERSETRCGGESGVDHAAREKLSGSQSG